ncbi:MAG: hypothetical protein QXU99_04980 [Candidatus Bathyarchaeia archaeon]
MSENLCRMLVENFLENSWPCVEALVERLTQFNVEKNQKPVTLFQFKNNVKVNKVFDARHFFLRSSVEYSNPQLTVEEVQGIIAARLIAECGNYFYAYGLHKPTIDDVAVICESLKRPSEGFVVPFLLNTDDVEPDRYSMNPLRQSLVTSGQSAFPAANVTTENLTVDNSFTTKYNGTLISSNEIQLISNYLETVKSYVDFVDSVKFTQMDELSKVFGMDLKLHALRMPIETLKAEDKHGLLHQIISETHKSYDTVKQAYDCMGRSITKRTTLLTVPHSVKGYGSKRAARGKIHFIASRIESVTVKYETTKLYPNAIDPADVSIAQCQDSFVVSGNSLADYEYVKIPSSPQFFLYALGSPEDAALWHGIGAYASPQLVQSYLAVRNVCRKGLLLADLTEQYGLSLIAPLQFNLTPECMWVHPLHRNIDASIGCVENLAELARMGLKVETLTINVSK